MCESERAYNNTQRNYFKKIKIIKKKKKWPKPRRELGTPRSLN